MPSARFSRASLAREFVRSGRMSVRASGGRWEPTDRDLVFTPRAIAGWPGTTGNARRSPAIRRARGNGRVGSQESGEPSSLGGSILPVPDPAAKGRLRLAPSP